MLLNGIRVLQSAEQTIRTRNFTRIRKKSESDEMKILKCFLIFVRVHRYIDIPDHFVGPCCRSNVQDVIHDSTVHHHHSRSRCPLARSTRHYIIH